jgi:hypothetical protein
MTRILLGECGVDTGQLVIIDPSYIAQGLFDETTQRECDTIKGSGKPGGSVLRDLAVVTLTGIGDGSYPVYATVEEIPGWGERVTRIEIDFTQHVFLEDSPEAK